MANRDFSDSVKFEVVKGNLEKNSGSILCEICRKKIVSINECHFDHIFPYAKGGTSSLDNCQILCAECNLKKNDKLIQDFVLEEKARQFLSGKVFDTDKEEEVEERVTSTSMTDRKQMTKEEFDILVGDFIKRKGDIHKVDFSREYNNLPSIHYVKIYYGDLNSLKKAFGIIDLTLNWNRENIKEALIEFVNCHGDILQKDMKKENGLPSLPCVLSYYPEYKAFTDIKRELCGLYVKDDWTVESCILAGKEYLKSHDKITQKSFRTENNMPALNTVERLFGSMMKYQEALGATITKRNEFISKDEIREAVREVFPDGNRVVQSRAEFFKMFKYSISSVLKRYGSFENFCMEEGIEVISYKKAKYSKNDVDEAIAQWIKNGNDIPARQTGLAKLGLPSAAAIMKFYENWREPFEIFKRMYEKMK